MLTEQNRENIYYDIYLTFVNLRKKKTINGIRFIIRTRDYHVPDATGAAILITKSGISNHAASDIPDHLCFSKFGTFHVVCPQTADNLRTFCVCPLLAPQQFNTFVLCNSLQFVSPPLIASLPIP